MLRQRSVLFRNSLSRRHPISPLKALKAIEKREKDKKMYDNVLHFSILFGTFVLVRLLHRNDYKKDMYQELD